MFKGYLNSYLTKTKLSPLLNCSPSHLGTCSPPFTWLSNAKATSHPVCLSFSLNPSAFISKSCWLCLQRTSIIFLCPRCYHPSVSHISHQAPVANVSTFSLPKVYFLRGAKAIFTKYRSDCNSSLPLRMKCKLLR